MNTGSSRGAGAARPERLTRWQLTYRFLWRFMGPAQVGPPPYATQDELRRHERGNRPLAAASALPPAGYRIESYTDANGTRHQSLVPTEPRDGPH